MAAKPDLTARLGKWAAIMPLILAVCAVFGWALRTDAAVKQLQTHDVALNGTDRLARLEKGQQDEARRLDHIETLLTTLVGRTPQ